MIKDQLMLPLYNPPHMTRLTAALSILLALYMSLAQAGLCPCWLFRDVHRYHPHFAADPEQPHSHFYLFELYNSQTIASAPPFPLPARTLILVLALGSLWWHLTDADLPIAGWATSPPTPPPRRQVST
jgi:hypothetical protein